MKKYIMLLGILISLGIVAVLIATQVPTKPYANNNELTEITDSNLSQIYKNSEQGFSIRYPEGYTVNASYSSDSIDTGDKIFGTEFKIPTSIVSGTNLSQDSSIIIEQIPQTNECTAKLFLYEGATIYTATESGITYSIGTISDAAAGNRYELTVYALPGTNPCIGVKYFIHYGAFENYEPGTITEFDKDALIQEFDQIRRTLIINQ
ncbi:hypothetical protein IPF86_02875 [Candidatus Nomurabacteria bacterium]|nr:MAG: hypothetical protein IPF86_02875 [Candidatus Nomurabacteria bacterium]